MSDLMTGIAVACVVVLVVNIVYMLDSSCSNNEYLVQKLFSTKDKTADYIVSGLGAVFLFVMAGYISKSSVAWLPGTQTLPRVSVS